MILDWTIILNFVLTFVVGLLFGLAIKKGLVAFVLALVGFVIAGYVGLTFVPKISFSYEVTKFITYVVTYIHDVKLGAIAVSLTVILFLIGLAIGLWKG